MSAHTEVVYMCIDARYGDEAIRERVPKGYFLTWAGVARALLEDKPDALKYLKRQIEILQQAGKRVTVLHVVDHLDCAGCKVTGQDSREDHFSNLKKAGDLLRNDAAFTGIVLKGYLHDIEHPDILTEVPINPRQE